MIESKNILLPGGLKQFRILKSKYIIPEKNVLVIGAGAEKIAQKMVDSDAASVSFIVNDYESLINARITLPKGNAITLKMMDYESTDFNADKFDLVYAQASTSTSNRNKIIKEIKRILKYEGIFCISEITALKEDYPVFVKNLFASSDILPLKHNICKEYFIERNFEVLFEEDLSSSLKSFYESASQSLKEIIISLSDNEKSYYKKLLNKISHESNSYLKLGADKYIGFKMLILKNI
jgi:ubiquinone/menaquinone biosynthesis C-methylase UbiE